MYDRNKNKVATITPNNLQFTTRYDELNRVAETIDSSGAATRYSYDAAGNLSSMQDPRETQWHYIYEPNNTLKRSEATGKDGATYWNEYTYDPDGNITKLQDNSCTISYNTVNSQYTPDPLNRLLCVERQFAGAAYRTEYQYTQATLLSDVKYPGTNSWLHYNYNGFNQLNEIVGFTQPGCITYDNNGLLKGLNYANQTNTLYDYDADSRLKNIHIQSVAASILDLAYTHDKAGNITQLNNQTFTYDDANQLTQVSVKDTFQEQKPTAGTQGLKRGDYLAGSPLDFNTDAQAVISLDYDSSSIGFDFTNTAPRIKKILLTPDKEHTIHRITERMLDIYYSQNNYSYTTLPHSAWEYSKSADGVITINLKNVLATRYLKINVLYDNRDKMFAPKDKAEFLNSLVGMLRVYQEAASWTEDYEYDQGSNRSLQRITLVQNDTNTANYYPNSNRLKCDGRFAYVYDKAGNLIQKGNTYTIDGEIVTFITVGEGVIYWEYNYDLLNRLIKVTRNGTIAAEYVYDALGYRIVKKSVQGTVHYVFEGTEPIFEKNITTNEIKSYVYAFGKHLARVDGQIGDSAAPVYFYHTDQIGSVRAISNQAGEVVWAQSYLPFGEELPGGLRGSITNAFGFGGKEYDADVELYYFNSRFYDATNGRFINEDPARSGINWYAYASNNPVNRIDPTGNEDVDYAGNPGASDFLRANPGLLPKLHELNTYHSDHPFFTTNWDAFFSTKDEPVQNGAIISLDDLEQGLQLSKAARSAGLSDKEYIYSMLYWDAVAQGQVDIFASARMINKNVSAYFEEQNRQMVHSYSLGAPIMGLLYVGLSAATGHSVLLDRSYDWNEALGSGDLTMAYLATALAVTGAFSEARGMQQAAFAAKDTLYYDLADTHADDVLGVTKKGIYQIEQHLSNIDALDDPANQIMLQKIKSGDIGATEFRFYQHEIIESGIITGNSQELARIAHLQTLQIQRIDYVRGYQKLLYGEELYNKYMK